MMRMQMRVVADDQRCWGQGVRELDFPLVSMDIAVLYSGVVCYG